MIAVPLEGAQRRDGRDNDIAGMLMVGLGSGSSLAEAGRAQRDRQMVLNLADTRRRPRGPFRNVPLVPRPNLAGEHHPSTFGVNGDPRGFELGAPPQCLFDLLLDPGGTNLRGDSSNPG